MIPLLAGVFLLSLAGAVFFYKCIKPDVSNTLLAALIFGPATLVWIADKDPTELGAGGIYAKFESTLNERAQDVLQDPAHKWSILSLAKSDRVFDAAQGRGDCVEYLVLRPEHILRSSLADLNRYVVKTTISIKSALACGKLVGVVVLNDRQRYVASYDSNFFAEALSLWTILKNPAQIAEDEDWKGMRANEIAQWADQILFHTIFGAALIAPDKRINPGEGYVAFIRETDTLQYAWKELQSTRGAFLVVTDRQLVFKGVLKRTTVQDLLLGQLAGGPPSGPTLTRTAPPRTGPPPRHPLASPLPTQ